MGLKMSRKVGEVIIIDKNVRMTVDDIGNSRVKLDFEFPKIHTVIRAEVVQRAFNNGTLKELYDEKVDPEFHEQPVWKLVRDYGWDWIHAQQKLFDKLIKESR